MLRSESLKSEMKFQARYGVLLCIAVAFMTLLPSALGQDFTLTAAQPFSPFAVVPGEDSALNLAIKSVGTYSGTVDLACTITSQTSGNPPQCQVSPKSVKAPGGATITILTAPNNGGAVTPALYTVTITATAPSETALTVSQNVTVLSVTPQFTITVGTPVTPSSVPAGNGGQGTIIVSPLNDYTGNVTLSCASVSPLVTIPPVCSFSYPAGLTSLPVSLTPAMSTITILAQGPSPVGAVARSRGFYAVWIPLPMLALVGLGAAAGGKKSRKAWGLLALFVLSGALLLMPACANTSTVKNADNGITPSNTYTFTIIGVDALGNVSSNTTSTTSPSVTLTVTAPPTN
jgi:hypothetical protein